MKISAFHKAMGDEVFVNFPLYNADFTYASILFSWTPTPYADLIGGSKFPHSKLDPEIETMMPDYDLYPKINYSLGYTYRACPRTCDFCIVPKQNNDDKHHSIKEFHNPKFKKICLLNNNTLADPSWRDTFEEIKEAGLTLILEQGVDCRLVTEENAKYLKQVKPLYFAWDYIEHEQEIMNGLRHIKNAGIKDLRCFVLIGHNTTEQEDLYRVMKLKNLKVDPFVMPFNKHDLYQKRFARWVNFKAIFKTVKWKDYR